MLPTTIRERPQTVEDLLPAQLMARLEPLDLSSRKVFSGKLKGERRSKRRGESVEFADHRAYARGDDLRHVDWNIFARLDQLFLKLFLEEEDLSLHLVLDASASSGCGVPEKFLFMRRAAMALGYVGLVNLNRVTATAMGGAARGPDGVVRAFGEAGASLRDLRGRRRTRDLAEWLCALEPGGGYSFTEAASRIALARRGKGLMVVFSDFFMKDGYEPGLRRRVGRGYDVYPVQVLSPQEVDPPLTGDLRLKDVEDGDLTEVTISAPLLARYKANLAAYNAGLGRFCAARGMSLLTMRSDAPAEQLVLGALRARGVVS